MWLYATFCTLLYFCIKVRSMEATLHSSVLLFGQTNFIPNFDETDAEKRTPGLQCQKLSLSPKVTFFTKDQDYFDNNTELELYSPLSYVFVSPTRIGSSPLVTQTGAATAFYMYRTIYANELYLCVRSDGHSQGTSSFSGGNATVDWMILNVPPVDSVLFKTTLKSYACKWMNEGMEDGVTLISLDHVNIDQESRLHYDSVWLEESSDVNKICWADTPELQDIHGSIVISVLLIPLNLKRNESNSQKQYLAGRQKGVWPTDSNYKGVCFDIPFSTPFNTPPRVFVTAEMNTGGFHNPVTAWVHASSERGMTACVGAMYWTNTSKFANEDVFLHFLAFFGKFNLGLNSRKRMQIGYGILEIRGHTTVGVPDDFREDPLFPQKFKNFLLEIAKIDDLKIEATYAKKLEKFPGRKFFFKIAHINSSKTIEAMHALESYSKKAMSDIPFSVHPGEFPHTSVFFSRYFIVSKVVGFNFRFSGICVKGDQTAELCSTNKCGNPGTQIINYPTVIKGFGEDADNCPFDNYIVACNEGPCNLKSLSYPLKMDLEEKLVPVNSSVVPYLLLIAILFALIISNFLLGLCIWIKLRSINLFGNRKHIHSLVKSKAFY